ncbi:MAG: DUF92 domain-containing protein [Eubacteriales bacterium]
MQNIFGILVSLAFIILIIAIATLLQKRGKLSNEGGRKFIHIAVSNWWIIAILFFDGPWWAAAVPALFVAANYLSYRFNIIKSMERGKGIEDLGTVWYAVSLLVLALWTFSVPDAKWIGLIAVLSMGYGDGFAAIVGKKFGKIRYPFKNMKKTLEGSLILFVAAFTISALVLLIFRPENVIRDAFILAMAAALIELITPLGFDNLTLPLGLALLITWMNTDSLNADIIMGISLSFLIILPAWAKKALTLPAGLGALVIGTVIFYSGGYVFFGMLAAFYISSVVAGAIGKSKKIKVAQLVHQRPGTRNLIQVIMNGGIAMLCALVYKLTEFEPFAFAYMACISAAASDTWASEIGMLSTKDPRSILTGKFVQRGISGGVTKLGVLGSVVGASIITFISFFYNTSNGFYINKGFVLLIVFLGGIIGSVLDSILGDTIQAKFQHPGSNKLTERPFVEGVRTKLKRGFKFVNNDIVNLLSSFASGTIILLTAILLG